MAPKNNFIDRLKNSLQYTRECLNDKLEKLISSGNLMDNSFLDDLESILLSADIGINTTNSIIKSLKSTLPKGKIEKNTLMAMLRMQMLNQFKSSGRAETTKYEVPDVILMVGVNGVGKTTTIGKLAYYYQQQEKKVMLVAADTFRAAAQEQLSIWGERLAIPVVATSTKNNDPASVVYSGLQSAYKKTDIIIIDTAGRLHTKTHLMDELKKIYRVIKKFNAKLSIEVTLTIDANTGQNSLLQAQQFNKTIPIDSIILSKLDGTAKGGIIFPLSKELRIPIRFIGCGEQPKDLQKFDIERYINGLLSIDNLL